MRAPRWFRIMRVGMTRRPKDRRKWAKMIIRFECVDGDLVKTRDNALKATDRMIDSMAGIA